MRNIFYIIAIVVLLVVGFFAFNNYIYNQKQGDVEIVTEPEPIYVPDFEGEADPSIMTLTMKPWTWVSGRRGDDALIAPRNPEKFVLTFNSDGRFSATTDCNSMGGSYTASGTALTFGQMFSTKMFCEDSQEQIFADLLRDVTSYQFTSKGELIMVVKVEGEAVFK